MDDNMRKALEAAAANGNQGPGVVPLLIVGLFGLVMIAALWKIFTKAGQPGWAAIIPIYNTIVLLKIAGKPTWWIVLFLIPIVSFVMLILTYVGLANNFGKGGGFAVGLVLLSPVFIPILGFGSAQYRGGAPGIAAAAAA
jgi:hypothetical protein